MSEYIIKGGKKVEGEVAISGSKNASLPIIAASILNQGKTTLYKVWKLFAPRSLAALTTFTSILEMTL